MLYCSLQPSALSITHLTAHTLPLTAAVSPSRHSHGNGNPAKTVSYQLNASWIPDSSGMTMGEKVEELDDN